MHGAVVRQKLDGRQRTSLVLQIPILARLLEQVIELIDLHFARAVFVDHCIPCRMGYSATQHGTRSRSTRQTRALGPTELALSFNTVTVGVEREGGRGGSGLSVRTERAGGVLTSECATDVSQVGRPAVRLKSMSTNSSSVIASPLLHRNAITIRRRIGVL